MTQAINDLFSAADQAESGHAAIEYALLMSLVSVAGIFAYIQLGSTLQATFAWLAQVITAAA